MEDGLVQEFNKLSNYEKLVLILIVVEDGLVQVRPVPSNFLPGGLNPYCSGRWSRTYTVVHIDHYAVVVLILIVVEDGLVL